MGGIDNGRKSTNNEGIFAELRDKSPKKTGIKHEILPSLTMSSLFKHGGNGGVVLNECGSPKSDYLAKNRNSDFFYGYVVVLVAFFIMLLAYGTYYTFGIFLRPLSIEFGWTKAVTSGAYSLSTILSGLLAIVTGRLTDRFGSRRVVTLSGFLLGLGYLLMSQVSAIWQLYLFHGVMIGIGISGFFVPLLSTVTKWFVKRRAMMTGVVVAGIGAGTMIIPSVASWLICSYGWRISYVVVGIIALLFIVLAAQFLRRAPRQVGQLPYGQTELEGEGLVLQAGEFSAQKAIHTGQYWTLLAMFFCAGFCINTIIVHIASHAVELGILATMAAFTLTIIGGVSIVGRITMGSVADRMGNRPALIIGFILMSGVLLWLTVAKEMWMLCLFAVVFGFAYGGVITSESPMVAELFGLDSHGVLFGTISFGFTIGGAVGPVLAGHILDITGSYQVAFLVCAIVAIIAFILTWLLRPIGEGKKSRIRN